MAAGERFEHQLEVLEGYWLVNYMMRSFPIIDWDTNEVIIESVEQDFDILLEFDKADYAVSIIVSYDGGAIADQVTNYTVTYGNPFTTSFSVEPGYTPYQTQAGPGVSVNIRNKTITIAKVSGDTEVKIICR